MAFTIFLSSEMHSLSGIRKYVKKQLEASLRHIPVEVTGIDFQGGADGISTMGQCISLLQQADMFVVLLGTQMGHYNEYGFTGTEIEIQTALRLQVPKILVDLSPGMAGARDPQVALLDQWLKDSSGRYFRHIRIDDMKTLLSRLVYTIERDHAMIKSLHKRSYFHTLYNPAGHELNSFGNSDIAITNFEFHYHQLLTEYQVYTYNGDISQLFSRRFYIYAFIRDLLSSDFQYLSNPKKHRVFLSQAASALQLFAEGFNFVQQVGETNRAALWCADTASYIYLLLRDLERYKSSLVPHIHTFYTMASGQKQQFSRQMGPLNPKRKLLLEKAQHYSDYLYYLDSRSPKKSLLLPDNGYRAFIFRELGDPEGAVKLFRKFMEKQAEFGINPYFHLSELIYTQSMSADQTGFKRNLDRLETYFTGRKVASFEMLIGRKLMDTYFNMGEDKKALSLYEELMFAAGQLHSNGEKVKLTKSQQFFRRK